LCHYDEAIPSGAALPEYSLHINGVDRPVTAEADTPLLWVLRDNLAMTGTKYGCGMAQCGACTIHVDDVPMRSCTLPVSAVGERRITTIEGSPSPQLAALQRAWVDADVAQCGYCQVGMLMSASTLLRQHAAPTDAQIDTALRAHICRCGTYSRIRDAVKRAAQSLSSATGSEAAR
jgi:aerobic-type carbon monoxide dehydrogenase small subunit (CoxS/CutS family)